MESAHYIRKKELAAIVGVYPSAISNKFKKNHPAVLGTKINLLHETVQEYINEHGASQNQPPVSPNRVQPIQQPTFIAPAIPEDVPKPQLPEELASLTLEEIVNLYGHLPAFKSYVSALKELEVLKLKNTKSQHDRGLLIDKAHAGKILLDILEMLFKRLVNEIPKTGIKRIISIARRNEADSEIEAVKAYQEINSRALNVCKNEILTRLEMTEAELLEVKSVS